MRTVVDLAEGTAEVIGKVDPDASGHVDLVDWLSGGLDGLDRLYVPRNDRRWLQRNALVAAGNTGGERTRAAVEHHAHGEDGMLAEHARWALERMAARS